MALHRTSGNRRLGLILASVTMSIWGVLPLSLDLLLTVLPSATIVWVRFTIAVGCLAAFLTWRGALPRLGELSPRDWALLAVATGGLAANYITFMLALDMTSPATTQVLIQLGPLLLALGGIAIFRERFTRLQWLGFGVLVTGLGGFFAAQLQHLPDQAEGTIAGAFMLVVSAATWAIYALAQKQLLTKMDALPLMLCIFVGCGILFAPLTVPSAILEVRGLAIPALVFAALATLVAYGCFSASLAHVEASRVSAVLALVPLTTLTVSAGASALVPQYVPPDPVSLAGFVAASFVVVGALLTALGGASEPRLTRDEDSR